MFGSTKVRSSLLATFSSVALLASLEARGVTKTVDLDGNAANGAESQCDLNVLQTFPVMIEAKVTNKSGGDAFTFSWPSAGPGGFTSSVPAGTAGGVGAKWVWTTNQSVFAFTGTSCANDVCFAQTSGPDPITSFCNYACLADGTSVTLTKGAAAGSVVLSWAGGQGAFTVYRSSVKTGVAVPENAIGTTDLLTLNDTPPPNTTFFYVVRGTDCTTRKACTTDSNCSAPGDGPCVSRGPFGVPGRSLFSSSVTVSAASLTSSLITFFSPPKEIFRMTSIGSVAGTETKGTNLGTSSITYTVEAYPHGCCPANPEVPHQLRCGATCVDYLNDPDNCGGCGNVCGDGACCSNGSCESVCATGQQWCDDQCVDTENDNKNCGACGSPCPDGTCCNGAECASICLDGEVWCGDACVDPANDSDNCGACGNKCSDGTCCNDGSCVSVCPLGREWCNGQCVDVVNDSDNCGACGSACSDDACCSEGVCASACGEGKTWCDGLCADVANDSDNCGACGNKCEEGSCCSAGVCASVCGAGRTYCDGTCYATGSDPDNCGACGNKCADNQTCNNGTCVTCSGQGGADDSCNNLCTNTNTDPYNCGACGVSCNLGCPSGFKGVCSNGQSCHCVQGTPAPQPPSNIPPPTAPVCPNPDPSPGPEPSACPNPHPSSPIPGSCPNPDPSSPHPGYCPNPHPSPGPIAGVCPDGGEPAPLPDETLICTIEEHTETVAPGASASTCNPGGGLFKEVPTTVTVCGDGIPGVEGQCNNATTKITTGTFNRLVADPTKTAGNAYVTPYAVHILSDTSNDGLLQPGESAGLQIDVVNAGLLNINLASATVSAALVDLSDDGVANPVALTLGTAAASYGTILGTPVSTNCTAPAVHPASNVTVFPITVPAGHPGDTSHEITLAVTGTVDGGPFTMDVPITLGIADKCIAAANARDFDGVEGLLSPMAKLVPTGDPVPFPTKAFSAGNTRPMKVAMSCGGANLTDSMIDPPEIVGLSEATLGPLDIHLLNLNSDNTNNPNDPFFRFNNTLQGGHWTYTMRTSLLGTGTFTLTIRIAGRKDYVTGFVLN
jgi:hypothetical protein